MAETEQTTAAEAPASKKKSKLVLWLILGAAIVLLGGGGFLAQKYLQKSAPAAGSDDAKSDVKSMMNLDSFLVNLADTESTRFVKVTFRLGLDTEGVGEDYSSNPVILAATRDKIISLLSTRTAEDILTIEGKDRLRSEIKEQVNRILPEGQVIEVFIIDFVVQL